MGWGKNKSEPDPNDPASLLDQLMGNHRNLTANEKEKAKPPWEEQDCCPSFLAGMCPNNFFSTSQKRSELPPCEHAVHNPSIRAEFQRANLPVLAKYEANLLGKLRALVRTMDERVVKTKDRVKLEAASTDLEPGFKKSTEALGELTAKIASLVSKAEEAGNEGDVEVAEKSLAEVEELTKQKKVLETQVAANKEATAIRITGTMFGEQEVCEVCCSVTNKKDELNNERHREGQMHVGWTDIRVELKRLEEKRDAARGGGGGGGGGGAPGGGGGELEDGEEEEGELKGEVAGGGGSSRGRGRSRSRSRDRGRYRSRSRSRDRHRRRDRSYSREGRGRGRGGEGRGGGGGGGQGRSRSRSRSRDRHRRRSRDRSYSRDGGRGWGRRDDDRYDRYDRYAEYGRR